MIRISLPMITAGRSRYSEGAPVMQRYSAQARLRDPRTP
jgi:hypothetical protein